MSAGSVVGTWLAPGIDYIAALLGVFRAGAAILPLDPATPAPRLSAMFQVAAPHVMLTSRSAPDPAPAHASLEPGIGWIDLDGVEAQPCGADDVSAGDATCYILFTSGSTGAPRGIAGRHAGLAHFIRWEVGEFALDATCRGSLLAPLPFDVSLRDILAPLAAGGTVCVPGPAVRTQVHRLLHWLKAQRVTQVHCVPSLFRLLLLELEGRPGEELPDLRRVLLAGEPLYAGDVNRWRDRMGGRIELVNLYGPTETTLAKSFHRIGDLPPDAAGIIPLGRAIDGAELLIMNGGERAAANTTGEICIRTAFAGNGFYGDAALTAETFARDGDARGTVVFRTGDLGRQREDGIVEFVGRADNQVKVRGVRVELGDVETHLRRHPAVRDAAVTAVREPDGGNRLRAFVVVSDARADGDLRAFLADCLPAAMVPSEFVRIDRLPLTDRGKLDRAALAELGARPGGGTEPGREPTAIEARLMALWTGELGFESVSVGDSFLDLGGDSLKAMRAISLLYRDFGVELSLGALLRERSIERLAALIDAGGGSGEEAIR